MNAPNHLQVVQKNEELLLFLFYVLKWLDDVEIEQVVLRISAGVWEMHKVTEKNCKHEICSVCFCCITPSLELLGSILFQKSLLTSSLSRVLLVFFVAYRWKRTLISTIKFYPRLIRYAFLFFSNNYDTFEISSWYSSPFFSHSSIPANHFSSPSNLFPPTSSNPFPISSVISVIIQSQLSKIGVLPAFPPHSRFSSDSFYVISKLP